MSVGLLMMASNDAEKKLVAYCVFVRWKDGNFYAHPRRHVAQEKPAMKMFYENVW